MGSLASIAVHYVLLAQNSTVFIFKMEMSVCWMGIEITYGFLNKDIKANSWWDYRFDPFHFGTLEWSFNRGFDVIRG